MASTVLPPGHEAWEVFVVLVHELSEAECSAVLARTGFGRLGYSQLNQPFIAPTFFAFDADAEGLYAFSSVGHKVEAMRRNARVCLEVEEILDRDHWTTVLVLGRYRELRGDLPDPDRAVKLRAEQLLLQRPECWLPGAARLSSAEPERAVVYQIVIDRMTGRRAQRGRPQTADPTPLA